MNAICLIVDRLNAGYLGSYGNAWTETAHFDRLAAESFVFDQVLVDSPDVGLLYRSYWQGWHAMRADVPPADRPPIVAELARLLRPGGRLFSREPTSSRHGMPAAEARRLFSAAGLAEMLATERRAPVLGRHYRAVWTKPAR